MAMAPVSMGLTRGMILVGTGFFGSVMYGNDKLRDFLKDGNSEKPDAIAEAIKEKLQQIEGLIRDRGSSGQVTILNGDSSQTGSVASLVMRAATLGALSYGYMWWKGISISDIMYVSKASMETAVSGMKRNLEQVSNALIATKKNLTQRLQHMDEKLIDQKAMSESIKQEVTDARSDLAQIGFDLQTLCEVIQDLDGKMFSMEVKQDAANAGLVYLHNFVGAKDGKNSACIEVADKPFSEVHRLLGEEEKSSKIKVIRRIPHLLESNNFDKSITNAWMPNGLESPGILSRAVSMGC